MLSFDFDGQQAHKEYTGIYEGKKIYTLKNVPIRKKEFSLWLFTAPVPI